MSPATRCELIVELIDQVLDDCGVPTVGASCAAVPATDAGHRRGVVDDARASGLRTRLQRDVMGPFWASGGRRHD